MVVVVCVVLLMLLLPSKFYMLIAWFAHLAPRHPPLERHLAAAVHPCLHVLAGTASGGAFLDRDLSLGTSLITTVTPVASLGACLIIQVYKCYSCCRLCSLCMYR
jgi:hypothetical protein